MAKDDKEAKKGGGKMKLIVIAVVVLIAAGGGYKVLGKGGKKEDAAEKKKKEQPPAGEILSIEPTTVNLADGRYLKVGVALQLAKSASAEKMETEQAKAQDAAIELFGERTAPQLMSPKGKEQAKKELSKRIVKLYTEEDVQKVLGIYFTEFVIQ
jgi:flagellar protein FliL